VSPLHEIEHVQLDMSPGGEERAREFYVGVLGLREIPMAVQSRAGGGIWFGIDRDGGSQIHLRTMRTLQPPEESHTAIRVTRLAELATRCDHAGYDPEHDDRYPGRKRFYVRDPFGNRLELFEVVDETRA
jgi:catechol 2,3-dioxygenase-like lactoylglutathione lyase family enzyme